MEDARPNRAAEVDGVKDQIDIVCGPLLNFKGMKDAVADTSIWRGSALIVTRLTRRRPELRLRCQGPQMAPGSNETENTNGDSIINPSTKASVSAVRLYEDSNKIFWRFAINLPLQEYEARWAYSIVNPHRFTNAASRSTSEYTFVVPSASQSMRIMFHSCNGFSVGTDEDAWSGPALWNDVLRSHEQTPFHVMIGGGDQIYNDAVRVKGPLKAWTEIANPKKRRDYPFDEALRVDCDSFYYDNYASWYSTEPFASANSRIPQVNIWDDHDIIDGFGSYTDHFMKCAVFKGIGSVSFKYYCLFQHHIPPPKSTFTTSSPQPTHVQSINGAGADPVQLKDNYVHNEANEDPGFIFGAKPGPYILERSRSLYMRLGARLAFLGIDARTERTRHQVNYPETYDAIFERVRLELSATTKNKITHLIVLLGVPIAYPRLIWLENIFTSPLIGPIRFLSKRFGVAGGFFNHFDGQVDLLDDLDDHYTARQHKFERKELMHRLQNLAQAHNVRITILGGDVHLAAVGRFYANPKLSIPSEEDHRYMVNIISSAITNKPPPKAVADLLARRNKIHHLDHSTDETLMKMFNKDPGNVTKTANHNKVTMPSRNYAIISESRNSTAHANGQVSETRANGAMGNGESDTSTPRPKANGKSYDGHYPLHAGEEGAGTAHAAINGNGGTALSGGLDVCLQVEIDQHDKQGKTEAYGFNIPPLQLRKDV